MKLQYLIGAALLTVSTPAGAVGGGLGPDVGAGNSAEVAAIRAGHADAVRPPNGKSPVGSHGDVTSHTGGTKAGPGGSDK